MERATRIYTDRGNPVPPLVFDPTDPGFREDPYPTYARMRDEAPVLRLSSDTWVMTRYEDCRDVLGDPAMGMVVPGEDVPPELAGGAAARIFPNILTFNDGVRHARMRRLVAKAFTPRAVSRLEGRIATVVEELLEPALRRGGFDVMSDFAFEVPVLVICEMLGIPAEDRMSFKRWTPDFSRIFESQWSTPEQISACHEATEGLCDYMERHVARRRRDPGAEILDGLIAAEDDGERLSHDELLGISVQLLNAGYETTMGLIGNGIHALLVHPGELRKVREDPAILPHVVEECLRWDSPVQYSGRAAKQAREVRGVRIEPGDLVLTMLGAANRDPHLCDSPERFDVTRREVAHLAFGFGTHFCIGAHLARLEAQLAIGGLLRRVKGVKVAGPKPTHRASLLFRTLESLPVEFTGVARVR